MDYTNVVIHQQQIIQLILSQLQEWKMYAAMVSLEKESGINANDYTSDLSFLRSLILDGKFSEAIAFVEPLQEIPGFNYKLYKFYCLKENFLELLSNWKNQNSHSFSSLNDCLQELKLYSPSKDKFNYLCWLLTLEDHRCLKEYKTWTTISGRAECFYQILPLVEIYLASTANTMLQNQAKELDKMNNLKDRLTTLLSKGCLHDIYLNYKKNDEVCIDVIPNVTHPRIDLLNPLADNHCYIYEYMKQTPASVWPTKLGEIQTKIKKEVAPNHTKGVKIANCYADNKLCQFNMRRSVSVPNGLNDSPADNKISARFNPRKRSASLDKFYNFKILSGTIPLLKRSFVNIDGRSDDQPTQLDALRDPGEKFKNELPSQQDATSSINIDTSHIEHSNSSVDRKDVAHSLIGNDANTSNIANELHYGHDEIIDQNEESESIPAEHKITRPLFANIATIKASQAVRTVTFHPNGEAFVVGSNSRVLRICSAELLHAKDEFDPNLPPPEPRVIFSRERHHRGSIYCANWNRSGELLATGSNDKSIKLLRFDNHEFIPVGSVQDFNFHTGTVRDITFDTDHSSFLISGGGGDCSINIIDCASEQLITALRGHSAHVLALYSWGYQKLISGSTDGMVCIWDINSGKCTKTLRLSESPVKQGVTSLCVNHDNTLAAMGREDGVCILYDLRADKTLHTFHPHNEDCRSLRFSPDSRYLLSASYDGTLILTDMNGYENSYPSFIVGQHSEKALKVSWHPEQYAFVSSSSDGEASLWKMLAT